MFEANYKLIEIKLFDFVPFTGIFTLGHRACEAEERMFLPANMLRILLIFANALVSIFILLGCAIAFGW